MSTDFTIFDHGSVVVFKPITEEARAWVSDHIPADAQYWCGGVVIEPRYVDDIVAGAQDDGLTVEFQ